MNEPRNLAILLFDDVEDLDFCGPLEVFSVASRQTASPAFNVFTVGETSPVKTHNGMRVIPDHSLTDCPTADVLIVPGGIGSRAQMNNESVIRWIKTKAGRAELVLSVCTGALLLARAGLLDGMEATTHHVAFDTLSEVAPGTIVHRDRRFVDNGRIITSAGIAAGIDMSLYVVAKLCSDEIAAATAKHMEYP